MRLRRNNSCLDGTFGDQLRVVFSNSPVRPVSTLCITPNVALDRTLVVPGFAAGNVVRAERVHCAIGGKGLNVARGLASLGKANHSAGLIGGVSGDLAAKAAIADGLTATWTRIAGETRTCVIILSGTDCATVINEPGPVVSDSEWQRFESEVSQLSHGRSAICISGSLPPGCPPRAMRRLLAAVAVEGRPVWIDSSGGPLADAIEAPVFAVKVNAEEATLATGRPVHSVTDALAAAQAIVERGVTRASITLGAKGAVLVGRGGAWYARPPVVSARNPVGSGDAFLAGLIAAYGDGAKDDDALRFACACGTASSLTLRAGRFNPTEVARVAAEVAVHPISLV